MAVYGREAEAEHAFQVYLSLGSKRSVQDVAELTGRSVRTIQEYKKIFGWNERVNDYIARFGEYIPQEKLEKAGQEPDGPGIGGIENNGKENDIMDYQTYQLMCGKRPEQLKEDKELTPHEMIRKYDGGSGLGALTKNEYRLLLGSLIRDFAQRFRNGEVKINTIYEFERVVKLDLLLMGETVPVPGQITINNNTIGGAEYNIKVEQVLKDNPMAQNLLAEMWRSYNAPTPTFRETIDHYDEGMTSMKQLINDPTNQTNLTTGNAPALPNEDTPISTLAQAEAGEDEVTSGGAGIPINPPSFHGVSSNDSSMSTSFQTNPGEGSSRMVGGGDSSIPSSPGEETFHYDGYNANMMIIDDPLK